ncbi:MAG: FitA-like ribbon-helix-helix domain-containing protein [Cyanobium sp.]
MQGRWDVAQLLVRQLNGAVKEALRRRARRHGRSMEEEARLILAQAVAAEEEASLGAAGLGHRMATRMATLFADAGLDEPIGEWRGIDAIPPSFEA